MIREGAMDFFISVSLRRAEEIGKGALGFSFVCGSQGT